MNHSIAYCGSESDSHRISWQYVVSLCFLSKHSFSFSFPCQDMLHIAIICFTRLHFSPKYAIFVLYLLQRCRTLESTSVERMQGTCQSRRDEGERMTTICNNCGSTLADDVNFCPKCGTPAPSYYPYSGSSQADPTARSSSADALYPKASTDYGSPPHGMLEKNPYDQSPYGVLPPPILVPVSWTGQ